MHTKRGLMAEALVPPAFYAIDHAQAGPDATSDISMAGISVETVWQAVRSALRGEPSALPGGVPPGI